MQKARNLLMMLGALLMVGSAVLQYRVWRALDIPVTEAVADSIAVAFDAGNAFWATVIGAACGIGSAVLHHRIRQRETDRNGE